jgi:hypothetical protein
MKQGFRFVAAAVALLALAGCRAPAGGQGGQADAPMEMKIYTVPATQTSRLAMALGGVLGKRASVTDPAPGKLLVYAPRDAQASIAAALESLAKASPAQAAATQVNLHFWVVDARAGAGPDDPALKPLSATLDALRHAMGPLHFQIDQAAASLADSNHGGMISTTTPAGYTRTFAFHVGAVEGDGVALSLDYQDAEASGLRQLNTEVGARFGEYLVLAQAPGACPPSTTVSSIPTCPDKPALRLLIVRVDRLNAPA